MAEFHCPYCGSDDITVTIVIRESKALIEGAQCKKCGKTLSVEQIRRPPPAQSSSCFIATAAFGTDLAPDVVRLRQFRDQLLRQSELGRTFVAAYEKLSPPLARLIARSRLARLLTRNAVIRPARWLADRLG